MVAVGAAHALDAAKEKKLRLRMARKIVCCLSDQRQQFPGLFMTQVASNLWANRGHWSSRLGITYRRLGTARGFVAARILSGIVSLIWRRMPGLMGPITSVRSSL